MNLLKKEKRSELPALSDFLERPLTSMMDFLERPLVSFRDFWRETPVVDLAENDKEVNVRVEVPGMSPDELNVSYSEGILSVSGEKREKKEEKTGTVSFQESRFSSFKRDIPLGENLKWEDSKASYRNGVLNVSIPKKETESQKGKKITID
jgi:HSP20 family protein